MSRSRHARNLRYKSYISWFHREVKHWSPAWDERRESSKLVQEELADLEAAQMDPDLLLFGSVLTSTTGVLRRRPVSHDPLPDLSDLSDFEWRLSDEWDMECPCCASKYDDRDRGWWFDYYADEPSTMAPRWVDQWLDGALAPGHDYNYDYDYLDWVDDEPPDGFESAWCQGCGELHQHCAWEEPGCYVRLEDDVVVVDGPVIDLAAERVIERGDRVTRRKRARR